MTTTPAMPELPEPEGFMDQTLGGSPAFTADQMRAYALAALQAQPAVSDADVWELWLRVCAESDNLSTRVMIANFASAILALRPAQQAVPMTEAERAEVFRKAESRMVYDLELSWRDAVVRETEAHHGITAPAGGEVNRG